MRKSRYSSTHFYPWRSVEVMGQLHTPATLSSGTERPAHVV